MREVCLIAALHLMVCIPLFASSGIRSLDASGPAPEWAAKLLLFGQFVGDWECDVVLMKPDGSKIKGTCEWHFGWTLEGRAIQDVWIARYEGAEPKTAAGTYGTTLRWYDPKADLWHVLWVNARENSTHAFTAREAGSEIVLDGQDSPNHPYRWIFSQITPQSFHWRSASSPDGGKTWIVGQEMNVRRVHAALTQHSPQGDREAIKKLKQEWLDRESDRATLERILADDFVHPVAEGLFLSKQQHIDWAVKHPRSVDREAHFENLEVRLYGDTAIATGIVNDTDVSGGDSRKTIFTDVFAYRNGAWQAVSAEENTVSRPH
jgi:hypothetical protein